MTNEKVVSPLVSEYKRRSKFYKTCRALEELIYNFVNLLRFSTKRLALRITVVVVVVHQIMKKGLPNYD